MPRLYLNVTDGPVSQDNEGIELPDVEAAHIEAVRLLGATLAEAPVRILADQELSVDVTDSSGLVLYRVYAASIASAAARRLLAAER